MVTFTLTDPNGKPVLPAFFGIADSGADGSMFPMAVMNDLGIAKSDCDKLPQLGAGGKTSCYAWKGSKTLPANFYGLTVNLQVRFSATPFILLGREDFFSTFKVSFNQRMLRFTLETY
jgi:hypothetical protein